MANEFRIKKGLIVNGSGSVILDIQGSQGQLFSVTDQLSGSLFSVNDISGIPVLEAFSDTTVKIGQYTAEAIIVSGSNARITGSLFGTSSWAQNSISSSFASTASNGFPFTGSAKITGSLIVTGSINATDDIVAYSTSDARFKINISPISDPLYKLNQIHGVEFNWLENSEYHGFKGHDVGVIAQEIEKVLPEIVTTKDNGYKAVKYEKIIPLLIEAIKAQQSQINDLKEIIKNK